MLYLWCKISRKWIKDLIANLALLETLGFVLKVDICHYSGKIFLFGFTSGWKWVDCHHFCWFFAFRLAGTWLYFDPFPGYQQVSSWTFKIFHMCTFKKHRHYFWKSVAMTMKCENKKMGSWQRIFLHFLVDWDLKHKPGWPLEFFR